MIWIEGRRNGALGHALDALTDVLRAARQSVRRKAIGRGLLGDVGENFPRCALGRIKSGGRRLARLAPDCVAGIAREVLFDVGFGKRACDQCANEEPDTRHQQRILLERVSYGSGGLPAEPARLRARGIEELLTGVRGACTGIPDKLRRLLDDACGSVGRMRQLVPCRPESIRGLACSVLDSL